MQVCVGAQFFRQLPPLAFWSLLIASWPAVANELANPPPGSGRQQAPAPVIEATVDALLRRGLEPPDRPAPVAERGALRQEPLLPEQPWRSSSGMSLTELRMAAERASAQCRLQLQQASVRTAFSGVSDDVWGRGISWPTLPPGGGAAMEEAHWAGALMAAPGFKASVH